MDELRLFWRMLVSRGLSTQSMPGIKKSKSRVTVMLCSNATGADRIKPWIIGTAENPWALRNINVLAIGGKWRWNKKAQMTTEIMKQ
jgi:DDE superfamily endonuclease